MGRHLPRAMYRPGINSPRRLPEWDLARTKGAYPCGSLVDADDASLRACNREFLRGKSVSDRLGSSNEKTKAIAKPAKERGGPPAGEPIASEDERDTMSAFYFKRQEEPKRLSEAEEDRLFEL